MISTDYDSDFSDSSARRVKQELPVEVQRIIQMHNEPQFLDKLASTALNPQFTLKLFITFEKIFADTCARWIKDKKNKICIIAAFARVLPFAPHLIIFLEKYLEPEVEQNRSFDIFSASDNVEEPLQTLELQQILLSTWRLLNFDRRIICRIIECKKILSLIQHKNIAVRYLAVRVFSQLLSLADSKLDEMVREHVGQNELIPGDFDGQLRDLFFLSLLEKNRFQEASKLKSNSKNLAEGLSGYNLNDLTTQVFRCGNILLPRPNGPPSLPSSISLTSTTCRNMERIATSLLSNSPVLLYGLPGCGKTFLVSEFAKELAVESSMVTLHLNEQTDAKMLIGVYSTGKSPGTFVWRPGVLTTAVREGRWVFIEDLDRAPNEVIGVILPLIERGELLISNRGEIVKARRGFRLLASVRTSLSLKGDETLPVLPTLGARFWQRVAVEMPSNEELCQIIDKKFPTLHAFLPGIIDVYNRLLKLLENSSYSSKSKNLKSKAISPRDLFKWCRRLEGVLEAGGSKTGREPINDKTRYEMFQEGTDVFAASFQDTDSRRSVILLIAEAMHIDPQRAEYFINAHIPRYEESQQNLLIGRCCLNKRTQIYKSKRNVRPFANTVSAKRLLEQVGVAVSFEEPVLLVGETGIGKTAVVQQLADCLGNKLTVVNLSQQSEVGDLLGGYKPVNIKFLAMPLKDEFDELFLFTGLSETKNQKYLEQLSKHFVKEKWTQALKLWREASKMFEQILSTLKNKSRNNLALNFSSENPSKRRKIESKLQYLLELKPRWDRFSENLDQFEMQVRRGSKGLAFTFFESNIVKAARNGDWVLLDEINLAPPDTLESIADLLQSRSGESPSILLSETGNIERIYADPNFRVFGAMNPATDIGKRDLPPSLRSRFTEIYVESPDKSYDDLTSIIQVYLKGDTNNDEKAINDLAMLYIKTKQLSDERRLVDGANQAPHFSLRTFTRVLSYVKEIAPLYGLRRALSEGYSMGFLTVLDRESEKMLIPLIDHYLMGSLKNSKSILSQTPKYPDDGNKYVPFMNTSKNRHYWLLQGQEICEEQELYIRTPSVDRNLLNLVRAISTRRFPVLIQGPTSSGKTSMVEYLAKHSGNKCVRINNHEHTDLQEYLGSYVSATNGQLRFQEGILIQALRLGQWIILDELNLAPTDVLEALNRLLDDNREILVPETQVIIRPHDNFRLFATQNPPGHYGGRKILSRAFRNRFLELHFDDIPEEELETILKTRCQNVAPSDCGRIVKVYRELSNLRQSNRFFEHKNSYATLRDLFRWASRAYEKREELAANGFMLLAEKVRNSEERQAVKTIIENIMKVKINTIEQLYNETISPEIKLYKFVPHSQEIVWTNAMRRLYILVAHAIRNNEPVLLVGETGCGKTTVCQMLADAFSKRLYTVNAHQNMETGDLIGAHRPVRNRTTIMDDLRKDLIKALSLSGRVENDHHDLEFLLKTYKSLPETVMTELPVELHQKIDLNQTKVGALFEWSDGSLVQAMKNGQFFLLDEISLADDAVLERLNSVLETQRTILLAEKGPEDSFLRAKDGFQIFATMNPGGDYGKRELSPALRNRFTEIWVPSLSDQDDIFQIVESKLKEKFKLLSKAMVQFAEWFVCNYRQASTTSISVRDMITWVKFMNECSSQDAYFCIVQGAAMVFIDTLGANPAALLSSSSGSIKEERIKCLNYLGKLLGRDIKPLYSESIEIVDEAKFFKIGSFSIHKQSNLNINTNANTSINMDTSYTFEAPITKLNVMRVIRALQVQKPILIEGSPGVGKTTLIVALAHACNKTLTRINLSEQSDLMDLFGSDVPVEGAEAGQFEWHDAPFLQAMQKGEWVLLDEMNLASQPVLEGLNACLDHRGEVYISELDRTFKRHPNFFVFAAQNPHHQGGGRKGLPSSFVNRFTLVYADVFGPNDLKLICDKNFPTIPEETVSSVIKFVSRLEEEIIDKRTFGAEGGPWELNLRDILRWLQLLTSENPLLQVAHPSALIHTIIRQRFRTIKDRFEVEKIQNEIFPSTKVSRHLFHNVSPMGYQVGLAWLPRNPLIQNTDFSSNCINNRLSELESIMISVQQNIPCLLVGPSGTGKSAIIQHLSAMTGNQLVVVSLNSDTDIMDLIGGFEQNDPYRAVFLFLEGLVEFLKHTILSFLPSETSGEAIILLEKLINEEMPSRQLLSAITQKLHFIELLTNNNEFGKLAQQCQKLSETLLVKDKTQFEWVDGVLLKALKQGKWLVLDNANLCSASVLDRLNSLLEPNGFLRVNEHCGVDGETIIAKPHSNFRVFLTMDPRFGELSRAMRNRSLEIYLEPQLKFSHEIYKVVHLEASMQRFQRILQAVDQVNEKNLSLVFSVALDNLSWSDMPLLPRFVNSFNFEQSKELSFICQSYSSIYEDQANEKVRNLLLEIKNVFKSQYFCDGQVLHPLQNSPLVPAIVWFQKSEQVYCLGGLFEFILQINAAAQAQEHHRAALKNLKPTEMNRFQRSLIRKRVSTVIKDSTVNTAKFLETTLRSLAVFLQTQLLGTGQWNILKSNISSLFRFWWETFYLVTSKTFDEEEFQAHLAIGKDLLVIAKKQKFPLAKIFSDALENNFSCGLKFRTGLSMEIMWKQIRSEPIPNFHIFTVLIEMENLAARFDDLKWRASNVISDLGNIMSSLVKAYRCLLTSKVEGTTLVASLSQELSSLENRTSKEQKVTPFFQKQFETIRQCQILRQMRFYSSETNTDFDILVLSGHSTISLLRFCTATPLSKPLQIIDYFCNSDNEINPAKNNLSLQLLDKLSDIQSVKLNELELLESELPILGQKVTLLTSILNRNQVLDLNQVLSKLILEIVETHGDPVFNFWNDLCFPVGELNARENEDNASISLNLQEILKTNFLSSIHLIENVKEKNLSYYHSSALAWVEFAIGCIKLYIPDRAYDPVKRQRLELQRHIILRETLNLKLNSLKQFEQFFTGQDSNLRCQLLESDLSTLGEPPEILKNIYRPEFSEINQIQGEFNSLLEIVLESNISATITSAYDKNDDTSSKVLQLLETNVNQIISRLLSRYQAYKDLIQPAICILRCLQIGLSLAKIGISETHLVKNSCLELKKIVPFITVSDNIAPENFIRSHPMEYLAIVATSAHIEGKDILRSDVRNSLLQVVHELYNKWINQLENDRAVAQYHSGLYRFRGSAEDETEIENEQFEELFPSFDKEIIATPEDTSKSKIRETAIELAKVHSEIFLGASDPVKSIKELMRSLTVCVSSSSVASGDFAHPSLNCALFPGCLLLLEDKINEFSSSINPTLYNFYTDSNIPECRNLVRLVYKIQNRFRNLQSDDEIGHMKTLEDVIISCCDLLQFNHTDPLAKIITKVEKVHSFMYEWQFGGWVSNAKTDLRLYEDITATIISWRRLELSTWARLFDMDVSKCEDDAKSWWFIAYQTVIAAPLQISESPVKIRDYAQKLLIELETYFSSSILGQFPQRLKLLKQLQKHTEILELEIPSFSIISRALANFIAIYSRYEKPVLENLKKGRSSLDKLMRDVLLMASWKDTNIVALRDSAKRSHHKLFKIVKKFRAILSQPMENILKQGLPDEEVKNSNSDRLPNFCISVDPLALTLCASSVPQWCNKSDRFKNISSTLSLMERMTQIPSKFVDCYSHLNKFLEDIINSASELQKATPSNFSDETKDYINHLKSRKRKLFFDTLKDLRLMGIKNNLSQDIRSKQESLSAILSRLNYWEEFTVEGVEYYFHKSLDNILKTRDCAKKNSPDLNSVEVVRSTGFLEGFLQVIISQHNFISLISSNLKKLDLNLQIMKSLWSQKYGIRPYSSISDHFVALKWLPNILKVSLDLIEIHSKFSKTESGTIQTNLKNWIDQFINLKERWDYLPQLPPRVTTTEHLSVQNMIQDAVQQLTIYLADLQENRPDLDFVIDPIITWSKIIKSNEKDDYEKSSITQLDLSLSMLCDSVLVAIENYSKGISSLPTSSDNSGWFIKYISSTENCLSALHIKTIFHQIQDSFAVLAKLNLDDVQICQTASACFAIALPILQKYYSISLEAFKRYANTHRLTCKTSYILAKYFIQITAEGFCTPQKLGTQDEKTENLEEGVGLGDGDGDGAEDISKDYQDEELDELAQEASPNDKNEILDEKDAVDMADGDLDGEADEDGGDLDEEKNKDEIDEETGNLDELDPSTINEKMWDGGNDEIENNQQVDELKRKPNKDDITAPNKCSDGSSQDHSGEKGDQTDEEVVGDEQEDEVMQNSVEQAHININEEEILDLPDDMVLDDEDQRKDPGDEENIDNLSDIEEPEEEEQISHNTNDPAEEEQEELDAPAGDEILSSPDMDNGEENEENNAENSEDLGEKLERDKDQLGTDEKQGVVQYNQDNEIYTESNADISVEAGTELSEDKENNTNGNPASSSGLSQKETCQRQESSQDKTIPSGQDRSATGDKLSDANDEIQESVNDNEPFKKLGNVLEEWHRQQAKNHDFSEKNQDSNIKLEQNIYDLLHLDNEDAAPDTQALGAATQDQAHGLDDSMALDQENKDATDQFPQDEIDDNQIHDSDMKIDDISTPIDQESDDFCGDQRGAIIRQTGDNFNENVFLTLENSVEKMECMDQKLKKIHLQTTDELKLITHYRQQWNHYEFLTRDLSLSLTEQLRLILAPTLASKMRGDFRTGKRLNIKRIIPYIASQYRQDKIWMRRSIPSKRNYQVMLAVDDSKSMGESGSGSLAFETLVMISKSLSMLEVGEICVIGFGEDIKIAHDFDTPFNSNAGPKTLQCFDFQQNRTDITVLLKRSIEIFRSARMRAIHGAADLWQLEIIISDGICESRDRLEIKRLIREASEERVMIVFVIVDDIKNKKNGQSVMELNQAEFIDGKVITSRYLDSFPFQYYIVVRNVRDLPSVLATLLRQWFQEISESSS